MYKRIFKEETETGSIKMKRDFPFKYKGKQLILKSGQIYSIYKNDKFSEPYIKYPLTLTNITIELNKIDSDYYGIYKRSNKYNKIWNVVNENYKGINMIFKERFNPEGLTLKEARPVMSKDEIHTYVILSYGGHVERMDDIYNERESEYVRVSEIQEAISDDFEGSMDKEKGLAEYIDDSDKFLYGKILSIPAPKVISLEGGSTSRFNLEWTVTTNTILDKKAENELCDYINGQCSDGWGEGFEQSPIYEGNEVIELQDEEDGSYYNERTRVYVYASPWSSKSPDPKVIKRK